MHSEGVLLVLLGCFLAFEEWTGNLYLEEINERSHEEGGDNGTDTDYRLNAVDFLCCKKEKTDACNNTDYIGNDSDELELPDVPCI